MSLYKLLFKLCPYLRQLWRRVVRRASLVLLILGLSAVVNAFPALEQTTRGWSHQGTLFAGAQVDVDVLPNGRIIAIGESLLEIDARGRVLFEDTAVGDGHTEAHLFGPAISVDPEGGVHVVTRDGGGAFNTVGFFVRYRYRSPGGAWSPEVLVSTPHPRNYCVGVAGVGPDEAYIIVARVVGLGDDNFFGPAQLFHVKGQTLEYLRDYSNVWRFDHPLFLRRSMDQLYFAGGFGSPGGHASYMTASLAEGDVAGQLARSFARLRPWSDPESSARRGFPVVMPHPDGGTDFVMGTQTGNLYYAAGRYGEVVAESDLRLVFDDLGDWHTGMGRGAAASTADRSVVMVAGLRVMGPPPADGVTPHPGDGRMVARISYDGGQTFGQDMFIADGVINADGRTPFRMLALGSTFLFFYTTADGVQLSTFNAFRNNSTPTAHLDGESLVWVFNTTANRSYTLERIQADGTWETVLGPVQSIGQQFMWRVMLDESSGHGTGIFRVLTR